MTLHAAIEQVLRESRKPMSANELADYINSHRLYIKGDNTNVSSNQIHARISKHKELFQIDEYGISLIDLSIKPFKEFTVRFSEFLRLNQFVSDVLKQQEILASFLFLIYYKKQPGFKVPSTKFRETFRNEFFNLELEHPKLKGVFTPTIDFISSSLSEHEAEKIFFLISNFHFEIFPKPSQSEFSAFYNDTINVYSWKNNFRGGEFSTPKPVSLLMNSLYELPKNAVVFDPFAGRSSLLVELINTEQDRIQEVYAGDINQKSITLGSLNLYVSGIRNYEYKEKNAFLDWHENINADIVLTNPPVGGRTEETILKPDWQRQYTKDFSLNAIQLALFHTNSSGKALIIVPVSVLFETKKVSATIRATIVNEDLLQGVILLPNNVFKPYTSASTALLIFDKSRRSKNTGIFFYDASKINQSDFRKEISDISSTFHNEDSIRETARWVSKDEIQNNGYDLTVKKYLLQTFDTQEHLLLSDFIDDFFIGNYASADNINKEDGIPYIQIGDLSESEGLESINISELQSYISDIELVQSSVREIPNRAILISKVGTKLKPTIFDGTQKAVASSNIIVLKPRQNVLSEYIISQLQSEYVKKQIEVIRRYNAIPNINLKELLHIKIRNLSFEQQQQYVTTYYSKKISEIEKAESRIKDEELFNLISRIKHEVKQPVSSIGIDISVLTEYLKEKSEKKEPPSLDDYAIEPLSGQSETDIETTKVGAILKRIKECVNEAQETLHKAEETLNIGKAVLRFESFELKNFLEKVVKPLYVNENCVITITGQEQIIKSDKYQIKVLFKHVIENAVKHGFIIEKPKQENIIKIELVKGHQNGFIEIIVMNNGKPFSNGFNKKLFESEGITSNRDNGSGFGGYHIKRIIENHKGELKIADDEEVQFSDFKVKFKIYLPLTV